MLPPFVAVSFFMLEMWRAKTIQFCDNSSIKSKISGLVFCINYEDSKMFRWYNWG